MRKPGEPEVVPPVEEPLYLELKQLPAEDAVAGGRHGRHPVAHLLHLAAAVIGPQVSHTVVKEFRRPIYRRDRMGYQPLLNLPRDVKT